MMEVCSCVLLEVYERKLINRLKSNNHKGKPASAQTDNWIEWETSAAMRVLIRCNFVCFAHAVLQQLLPDWVSRPTCIIARVVWQAWKRSWYLNFVTLFPLWGQCVRHQLCVWYELALCLNVCHRGGGGGCFDLEMLFPGNKDTGCVMPSSVLPWLWRWRQVKREIVGWQD